MGIDTIGQLAALPIEQLTEEFGQSYGHYLYEASRGIDDSPIVTHWEPRSMSREMTFETDVRNWQVIAKTMAELTKDVVKAMREDGYRGRTVTLKIRFSDFESTHAVHQPPGTRRFRRDNPPHGLRVPEKSRTEKTGETDRGEDEQS